MQNIARKWPIKAHSEKFANGCTVRQCSIMER